MINSRSYETNLLTLHPVPTAIKRQLTKAFLHKQLYIDKVQYVAKDPAETEPIGTTNLYNFNITLQKTGNVFNSELDGNGNEISVEELPALLKTGNGYLKIN